MQCTVVYYIVHIAEVCVLEVISNILFSHQSEYYRYWRNCFYDIFTLLIAKLTQKVQISSLPAAKGNKASAVLERGGPVLTAGDAVGQPDVDPASQLLADQPQR